MKKTIFALALATGLTAFGGKATAQTPTNDLTNGLINYYMFNGNANDSVGGNNLSLTERVTLNSGSLFINSNINEFPPNHTTQPFSASNISITGHVSQSLSFWVKSSNASSLYAGVGFGYQPPTGGITELNIYTTNIWFHGYNADSPYIAISAPSDNAWNMCTFTYNTAETTNASLFYNGELVWSGNLNLGTAPGALYLYGNAGASLTDIGIWNTALSTNQVAELYTQQAQSVPEPSTYALFGLGAIGVVMVLRRKKTA